MKEGKWYPSPTRRRPPGIIADLSPGTVFLLHAMCASSSTRSAL
jgi:hypothetical protein